MPPNAPIQRRTPVSSRHARRGSVYIIVVGAALMATLLIMASVAAIRIQRRQLLDMQSFEQAQLYAQTGLDMGLFHIAEDPNRWRRDAGRAKWDVDTPIGWEGQLLEQAAYRIQFVDPVDGDIENSDFDHIVLIGIGRRGPAVQRLRMRLNIQLIGYGCMTSAMHASNTIVVDNATVTSDEWISSDNKVILANGADAYTDAASKNMPIADATSTYHGLTSEDGTWPRPLPPWPDVMDYYLENGTPIDIASLPLSDHDANLLSNWSFESGTQDWQAVDCTFTLDTSWKKDGLQSLKVTNRLHNLAGPVQDVTPLIFSGGTYFVSVEAKNLHLTEQVNGYVRLKVQSTGEGTQYFVTPPKLIDKNKNGKIEGTVTPTYTGQLIKAEWCVAVEHPTLPASDFDFNIDKAILSDHSYPDGYRVFARKLLSPNHNPFAPGVTNPEGIYILDCDDMIIEHNRIVGTLVLLNSDSATIRGPMNWEPYIFNFPAVVADRDLLLHTSTDDLVELTQRANFNPPGTPYEETSDSDQDDSYPSVIKGVVYANGDILFENQPVIEGIVISEGGIEVAPGTTLNLTYESKYYEDAAPGFRGTPILTVLPGSIHREVD